QAWTGGDQPRGNNTLEVESGETVDSRHVDQGCPQGGTRTDLCYRGHRHRLETQHSNRGYPLAGPRWRGPNGRVGGRCSLDTSDPSVTPAGSLVSWTGGGEVIKRPLLL